MTAPAISYHLPDVTCSFPWKLNEHFEDIERDVLNWATDVFRDYPTARHRIKHLQRSKFMLWLCMLYPHRNPSDLQLWGCFTTGFTLLDDASELVRLDGEPSNDSWWAEPYPLLRKGLTLLQTQGADDAELVDCSGLPHTIATAVHVMARMRSAATPDGREDILQRIGEHMDAVLEEGEINRSGRAEELDLATYLNLREKTYSSQIFAAGAVDDTRRRFPDAEALHDPRLHELRRHACLHMALANDLYSFRKEYIENHDRIESMVNLPAILHRSMTWQEAIDCGVEMVYEAERAYTSLRDAWLAEGDSAGVVRDVSRRLEFLMSGNVRFMKVSPRYHGSHFTGEFRGGKVTCDPADRGVYHPDVPSPDPTVPVPR